MLLQQFSPSRSLCSIHRNAAIPVLVTVHKQSESKVPRALEPHQPFLGVLVPSLPQQQHEAEIVLRFRVALLCGEAIPACSFHEVFRPGPISRRIHDTKFTLGVRASQLACAQDQPIMFRARKMCPMASQEPYRIRMIFRSGVFEEFLHAVACGIVVPGRAPEIVICELDRF